ncbi:hypothetical protein [Thermomonospora cellulosilytica]|uniref:Uncharacterized protein n=1 Tax=Thermomonospora cellulosilytica TaxID=1411118 RepID=A0A7W3N3M7_9ACTN|nr:hypothetical protein [Thermomonospora cellulosilytica]MBA9006904.1 hypothetical protein [Thermomonospora cellulosilytica]
MTTDPHDEYGEILRRALHAEAEKVEPAPDGLERIRAGIERRSGGRTWDPALWLPEWLRPSGGWARPVLAVAGVMLAVALGVSAPQTIDRIASVGDRGPSESREDPAVAASGSGSRQYPGAPVSPVDPDRPTGAPASPAPTASPGAPGNVACAPEDLPGIAATPSPTTPAPTASAVPCSGPTDPQPGGDDPGTPTGDPDSPTSSPESPTGVPQTPAPGETSAP